MGIKFIYPGFGFGNHQHRVDHIQQPITLFNGTGSHGFIFFIRGVGGQGNLGDPPDARNRAFEVMGYIVAHFPDAGNQGLNAIQHPVKRNGQLIDLVLVFFDGHPLHEAGF